MPLNWVPTVDIQQCELDGFSCVVVPCFDFFFSIFLIFFFLPKQANDAKLISIENDPRHVGYASKIVEFAGLAHKVQIILGSANEKIPVLKEKHGFPRLDFVFIDHDKEFYLPDLQVLEKSGLLQP
jgi:catechol O-methyltransferase